LIKNPDTYYPLRIRMTLFGSASSVDEPFSSGIIYGWGLIENAFNQGDAENNSSGSNWGANKYSNEAT